MRRYICYFFIVVMMLCIPVDLQAKKKKVAQEPTKVGKIVTIEDTVNGVLRSHRALRGMRENREVLTHEKRRAQAGFGPRVDLEGRVGPSIYSDASARNQDLDGTVYAYVSLSAKLVQPIWDGFATRARVREAMSALTSMEHRVFDTATSLSLDGIIAHINVERQERLHALAEENIRRHNEILRQTKERVNLGADTEADVSQTETRLARARATLTETEAELSSAKSTYMRVTGLVPERLEKVTLPPRLYKTADAVFEDAKKGNQKLAAYLQDIRVERAKKELAESSFYPTFNIEAGPSYSDRGGNRDRWVTSFDVMLTARWNIFNSGADVSAVQAAYARMRQARQTMYDYADTLLLDIKTTWYAYTAAKEQYELYSKAANLARATHVDYLEQFSIGRRSLLDVLDTVSEMHNSLSQAETARANTIIGAYRLLALTGDLLPAMKINTDILKKAVPRDAVNPRERFAQGWFK